jgi:hypothetical protein
MNGRGHTLSLDWLIQVSLPAPPSFIQYTGGFCNSGNPDFRAVYLDGSTNRFCRKRHTKAVFCFLISSRPLCGHGINTSISPPPGRSQLMRPPPARLHKSTKEIRYIVARASTPRPHLGPSPSSSAPALRPLPAHSYPPSSSLCDPHPGSSSSIRSALCRPLIPTSVVARNSRIAAVHLVPKRLRH